MQYVFFFPRLGNTRVHFLARTLQEKFLVPFLATVDREKAFEKVLQICWSLRKLDVDKQLMWAVQAKYRERNEESMLYWICYVSIYESLSTRELTEKLGTRGIRCSLQERRLHWYGHAMHIKDDIRVKKCINNLYERNL